MFPHKMTDPTNTFTKIMPDCSSIFPVKYFMIWQGDNINYVR